MWSMTEIQFPQATEYAEVTAVTVYSRYELAQHSAPRIIQIKNLYTASIGAEPMVHFTCQCCATDFVVRTSDIWYKSLGEIEPDLVTPT
jgi:hypothetical protein